MVCLVCVEAMLNAYLNKKIEQTNVVLPLFIFYYFLVFKPRRSSSSVVKSWRRMTSTMNNTCVICTKSILSM